MAIGDVLQIVAPGVAAFAAAPGSATPALYTFTGVAPAGGAGTAVFDLDLVGFPDNVVLLEARVLCTTKAGTAALVASAFVMSEAVVRVIAGVATFGTAAAGGAANPMPAQNNEMTVHPQTTDGGLQSGGGAAINAVWSVVGATAIARLTVTNGNAANAADVVAYVWLWRKAA